MHSRFCLLVSLLLVVACDRSDDGNSVTQYDDLRVFVDAVMHQQYLWAEQTPQVELSAYDSAETLLTDLRYELDRWSYLADIDAHQSFYAEGQYVGFGYTAHWTDDDALMLSIVQPGSPAAAAGLARGDRIVAIASIATTQLRQDAVAYRDALGPVEVGSSASFTVISRNGTQRNLSMTRAVVTIDPVPTYGVHDLGNGSTAGYILFHDHIDPSLPKLEAAFEQLVQAGADELILDLRYNGGGSLAVAQEFLSLILGNRGEILITTASFLPIAVSPPAPALPLFTLEYNDSGWHRDVHYTSVPSNGTTDLELDRVVILTGPNTASASETDIVALRPYLDVVLIGETSHGKPVGMNGFPHNASNQLLVPITFAVRNADGEGGYFDGIAPDAQVADDFSHDLGDADEALLATALAYLRGEGLPAVSAQARPSLGPDPQNMLSSWFGHIGKQ